MTVSSSKLFEPVKVGRMELQHRVVMAPLTRNRSDEDHAVTPPMMKEYYTQRAHVKGSLIITEATAITAESGPFAGCPGIYTDKQVAAWKEIVDAVHAKGSYMYLQIWHPGRASLKQLIPGNKPAVGPSPIAIEGRSLLVDTPNEVPRPLEVDEMPGIARDFAIAAKRAVEEAGFDGVEIHGGNGYLLDQFINTSSNKRTDEYGGSIENRARLCLEVTKAVADAIGSDRTALRLTPWSEFQDMEDETPYDTWGYIVSHLPQDLAYLHMLGPRDDFGRKTQNDTVNTLDPFRKLWKSTFMASGGFSTKPETAKELSDETGDLVAIGRAYIANPDLVLRLKNGWPLNKYHRPSFYGGDERGYIDYPFYQDEQSKE
ncbi:hypothetical protein O0I10_000901 [Lichtheimia ornata]|uniref:NADH:flavin oxidoreductase/NADH oxidase N-terminal domain-containing protein n=1 Tax=Lichtheimia ornata TaxID=688661 RepID=A0AAD7Y4I1_9FUNG|nr:uncharacterized protein O0I10_000901 [Lichtheimia ornata]KAJ8663653.1 hypothetical protein O0I10_000901 [Lichtheimia ornata]